jgi:alkanesulfonate monooxygenase SsuD/methylene tetrahydromethanopterin reductase-like flavin-dependent oxidoreductase (luciferase family)
MLGPLPPWKQIIDWAKLVESLGYDKLWLPDHFVNPDDKDMEWLDCWSTLTALATQTDKITMGTLVSSMAAATRPSWRWRYADHFRSDALNWELAQAAPKNATR